MLAVFCEVRKHISATQSHENSATCFRTCCGGDEPSTTVSDLVQPDI